MSVDLDADLQELLTRDGQVSVQLSQDGNEAQALSIDGTTATLTLPSEDMQGEHHYYIGVYYTSAKITAAVLVAEGEKTASGMQQLPFKSGDLKTIPYDKDNSNVIEESEKIVLDTDKDGKSNLAEILENGNPLNPQPTFLSLAQVQVPEKQPNSSPPPQLYTVYTAEALSPRDNATIAYSIVSGANQDRFNINTDTGELSFVNNASVKWPVYSLTSSNDYLVNIQAFDGTLSSILSLTVTVTDVFNLSVTVGIKSLQFTWFAVPNAVYYKLRENPDGNSGFPEVSGAEYITGLNYDLNISLYRFDQFNARFILEAYSETELLDTSEELSISDSLLAAVGFFKGPNARGGDWFGTSVSLSADGGTLAVGAHFESSAAISGGIDTGGSPKASDCDGVTNTQPNFQPSSGAVYLFEKRRGNPNIWDAGDFAAFFKASNAGAYDYFGASVSLSADGGTLAVGAGSESSAGVVDTDGSPTASDCDGATNTQPNCLLKSGAVYLFEKVRGTDSTNWDTGDFAAFLKAPNAGASDYFGTSVSLSADGGTLAVGAHKESSAAIAGGIDLQGSGAVYLFEKGRGTDSTNWDAGDFSAFFKAPNAGEGDLFGYSVSLSADGGTLAVGAYQESSAAIAGGINTSSIPKASDCSSATNTQNNCLSRSGAVYLFEKGRGADSTKWGAGDFAAFFKAPNAGANDYFGYSVSLSADGGTLAVGAFLESSAAIVGGINLPRSGAVYLFEKGRGTDSAN